MSSWIILLGVTGKIPSLLCAFALLCFFSSQEGLLCEEHYSDGDVYLPLVVKLLSIC